MKKGARMAQAAIAVQDPSPEDSEASFACYLKQIRRRLAGKQIWLSRAIGCSDAAISLWESGARLPNPRSVCRILTALAESGASTLELLALRRAWHREMMKRSLDTPLE
jgi:DNA-binding transcriptional regulator YiaG